MRLSLIGGPAASNVMAEPGRAADQLGAVPISPLMM